jgi:polyhydroxybutyrate depolymerase
MRGRLLTLLGFCILLCGLVATPDRLTAQEFEGITEPGNYRLGFMIGGVERSLNIFVPPDYDAEGDPLPLVLLLHGAGGTGAGLANITNFNELAATENIIVAYPDGYRGGWNDARPDTRTLPIDDVRVLSLMIDFLLDELHIDPTRVYAAGYSMGGMMSFRLGCQLGDKIAAVASVASTFPAYQLDSCLFTEPVPVLVIQGTEDTVIPVGGYRDRYGNRMMMSVDETMRYWSETNGCATGVRVQFLPDVDPDDGTRVRRSIYENCEGGVGTELLLITGGGHTWPGHPFTASVEVGGTSMDIDANAEIWRFFQAHGGE